MFPLQARRLQVCDALINLLNPGENMKKTLLIIPLLLLQITAQSQAVVRMEMPEQSDKALSASTLFEELLPLDIPVVLGPLGYDISGGTAPYNYRWLENDNIISEDSTVVITASTGNNYTLVIIDKNNCTVRIPVITETSSGINTGTEDDQVVTAWRSPAGNNILIRFNKQINSDVSIKLYDFKGVKYYESVINSDAVIPVSLPAGFYFLDIRGADFHYIRKIIFP